MFFVTNLGKYLYIVWLSLIDQQAETSNEEAVKSLRVKLEIVFGSVNSVELVEFQKSKEDVF